MAYTYSKISSVTVGSGGSSSIDFIAIPQNYTDLKLVLSTRNASSGIGTFRMGFNGNAGANYNYRFIQGNGAAASSSFGTGATPTSNEAGLNNGNTSTVNTFSNNEIYIPNYTGSNSKSWSADGVEEENATTAFIRLTAGLWTLTNPITSISFVQDAGSFAQHTTATLYGIKAEV